MARIGAYLAGLTLIGRVSRIGSPLLATAGVGLGVLDLRADGQTSAPLQATGASLVTGAIFARADASLEIVRWLRLGLRAVAGATTSAIKLDFAGNDAGTWGQPFVGGLVLADSELALSGRDAVLRARSARRRSRCRTGGSAT